MAMENNLGVRAERLNPEIQNYGVVRAHSAFTPALFSSLTRGNSATPPTDFLSTGGVGVITSGSFTTVAGDAADSAHRWAATTRCRATDRARRPTHRARCSAPARIPSQRVVYPAAAAQLQDRRVSSADADQRAEPPDRSRTSSCSSASPRPRGTCAPPTTTWSARSPGSTSRSNRSTSRVSRSRTTRPASKSGTMAPIDITSAEAEVASNEESVIIAERRSRRAQDQLRALVMNPSQPGFWDTRVQADATSPMLAPQAIDVDAAIKNALANRTDIRSSRRAWTAPTSIGEVRRRTRSCRRSTCRRATA